MFRWEERLLTDTDAVLWVGQLWVSWCEVRWLPDTDAVLLDGQMGVQVGGKVVT